MQHPACAAGTSGALSSWLPSCRPQRCWRQTLMQQHRHPHCSGAHTCNFVLLHALDRKPELTPGSRSSSSASGALEERLEVTARRVEAGLGHLVSSVLDAAQSAPSLFGVAPARVSTSLPAAADGEEVNAGGRMSLYASSSSGPPAALSCHPAGQLCCACAQQPAASAQPINPPQHCPAALRRLCHPAQSYSAQE